MWADVHSSARALWALGIEVPANVLGCTSGTLDGGNGVEKDAMDDASMGTAQDVAAVGATGDARVRHATQNPTPEIPELLRWRRMIVPGDKKVSLLLRGTTTGTSLRCRTTEQSVSQSCA